MNIAMLSCWHVHAPEYAREIAAFPGAKITAVWDEDPARGRKWADELGCLFVADYQAILDDPAIDGVAVCTPTNLHGEIMIRAANAGKHIYTEKVLALTNEEADAIAEAVARNHVHFTISFPHKTNPKLLYIKQMLTDGKLGPVTYARVRNVHSGAVKNWLPAHFYDPTQCGGGAMIDLGAHPMYLLEWLLGHPKKVASMFTKVTGRPVEDNAVSVIEFENGAVGVSETGFVSTCDPYVVEVSGTEGYVHLIGDTLRYRTEETNGNWVEVCQVPEKPSSAIFYWLTSIRDNTENTRFTIDDAVALTRIMVAAYTASREQRTETV
mgnify:CR=1 FL=1